MANQIDIEAIKEVYAAMGDEEILAFAKAAGLHLTADAISVLRDELRKRNIGEDIIREIEREIIFKYGLQAKKLADDVGKELFTRGLKLAIKMKLNAASNYELHEKLQDIGINSDYAFYII